MALSEADNAGAGTPDRSSQPLPLDSPVPAPGRPPALPVDPLHVSEDGVPDPGRPALPVRDDDARSPDPAVCPFLRRDAYGTMLAPSRRADADHVCAAIGAPRPQSMRQQELVCLEASHADCPRYLRGALLATPSPAPRSRKGPPRATIAALLVLILSAGISFGFVVQRGGIAMPVAEDGDAQAGAVATGVRTAPPASQPAAVTTTSPAPPTSSASPSPVSEPTPTPTAPPPPTPTAPPPPTPSVAPTPKASKAPKSDRYRLLVACPDRRKCWIYTVRSGDNLYSIANYFGHPLATIYAWNPQYPGTPLREGAQIRMPPPTR